MMTKEQEELYKWFDEELSCNFNKLVTRMNQFFESNVCIPKGDNPHPDADIIHQFAENINLDIQMDTYGGTWVFPGALIKCRLRIKPSEPVYEWQWLMVSVFSGTNALTPYMTDSEFDNAITSRGHKYTKIEETKRERRQ